MTAREKVKNIVKDFLVYAPKLLKIKTKDSEIIPFKLNKSQLKLYEIIKEQQQKKKPVRIIILKARQMGFSTLTEALIFYRTVTRKNTNSLIVAHKDESTNNLFNMSKLFYELLPDRWKPLKKASNAKELIFENPTKDLEEKRKYPGLRSKIKVATAGGDGVGRSDTLQNVHISEYAFWPGDKKLTLAGIMQSVPNNPNTMVIIESTANGYEHYKELWDAAVSGESGFVPVFFAWHEMEEYRLPYSGFELTEEEKTLKELYNLDNDQLEWRRWCIKNNCSGDVDLFKQEYPSWPEEAFLSTGRPVFDLNKVQTRLNQVRELGTRGYIDKNFNFIEDANGNLIIYEKPIKNYPYVIGGDVAEGIKDGDYSVSQVINNVTGRQAAVWRGHIAPDLFGYEQFKLAMYYNKALIADEVNNHGLTAIKALEYNNYLNQYRREVIDDNTNTKQHKFGFKTTPATRPVIIDLVREYVRENIELINDETTLREMLTFVFKENGKAEHEEGQHDDTILALAIALKAREQQSMRVKEKKKKPRRTYNSVTGY
ncbi:MAG: hypothetical protein PWP31_1805 [Clostridia bacterium]|nr:hypothetical protein [Clostridia bacterium]